jgi:hypothetical protein
MTTCNGSLDLISRSFGVFNLYLKKIQQQAFKISKNYRIFKI